MKRKLFIILSISLLSNFSISLSAHTITNEEKTGNANYTFSGYCDGNGLFQGSYNTAIPSAYACGPNGCKKAKNKNQVINYVCSVNSSNKIIFIQNINSAKKISKKQNSSLPTCNKESIDIADIILKIHQHKINSSPYYNCKKNSSKAGNGDAYYSLIFNGATNFFNTNKRGIINGIQAENLTKSQGENLIRKTKNIYPNQMKISYHNT